MSQAGILNVIENHPEIPVEFDGNTGTATPIGNVLNIVGNTSQGVSTAAALNTVTITVANATTASKGVAEFDPADFTVVSGVVSLIGPGTGDVVGPASSTDNAVVRFDGVTGKLIKDSPLTTLTNTGEFLTASGSTANCAYSFTGDPNTGIFRIFADGLGLVAGGTESIRVLNGAEIMNGIMRVNGGMSWAIRVSAISTAVIKPDVGLLATAGPITFTLPASPDDQEFHFFKDGTGNAGTNNITIDGNGHNIDNAATAVINANYGALFVIYDLNTTTWYIL